MTKIAWAASIVAQLMLVASLLRSGRRDAWTAYLVLDLARSAALWNTAGVTYSIVWEAGLLILVLVQFVAVQQNIQRGPWLNSWIYGASALWAWIAALSPVNWPTIRQGMMMTWNGSALICLAVIIGGHSGDVFLRTYYVIHAVLSSLVLASPDPDWAATLGFAQSVLVATLFSAWSLQIIRGRITENEQQ